MEKKNRTKTGQLVNRSKIKLSEMKSQL